MPISCSWYRTHVLPPGASFHVSLSTWLHLEWPPLPIPFWTSGFGGWAPGPHGWPLPLRPLSLSLTTVRHWPAQYSISTHSLLKPLRNPETRTLLLSLRAGEPCVWFLHHYCHDCCCHLNCHFFEEHRNAKCCIIIISFHFTLRANL